jgi:hypothetical protein
MRRTGGLFRLVKELSNELGGDAKKKAGGAPAFR